MNEEKNTDQEVKLTDVESSLSCANYGNALNELSTIINGISTSLMNFEFPKVTAVQMSQYIEIVNNLRKTNMALKTIASSLKNKE